MFKCTFQNQGQGELCRVARVKLRMYSWIADQLSAHEKLICQRTRRATTIPRPPLKALSKKNPHLPGQIFCDHFLVSCFLNQRKYGPNKKEPGRFGFSSSNTRLPRSQTLLRFLGSMANYFFSHVVKEIELICVCSIISCSRVPAIVQYETSFFYFFKNSIQQTTQNYARNVCLTH